MIIKLHPGDVFADVLLNFKPSAKIEIKFLTEWDYGHVILINNEPINQYACGSRFIYDGIPRLDLSNSALDAMLIISLIRL